MEGSAQELSDVNAARRRSSRGKDAIKRASADSALAPHVKSDAVSPSDLRLELSALHDVFGGHTTHEKHHNKNHTSSHSTHQTLQSVMNRQTQSTLFEHMYVWFENKTSADRKFVFKALMAYFILIVILFTIMWYCITTFQQDVSAIEAAGGEIVGTSNFSESIFAVFQLLMAYSLSVVPDYNGIPFMFIWINLSGMLLLAIIVAFLTDAVTDASRNLLAGRSKVFDTNHTVILGYNEATLRTIVQICFIRRMYQLANEEKFGRVLYYIPWLYTMLGWLGLLTTPSTSLAVNNIVLMTNSVAKEDMHREIQQAFVERGIDPWRSRLGTNIICRTGNPSNCNDLLRICAHKAAAFLIMMNADDDETEETDGYVQNGVTLRVLLALRYVLLSNAFSQDHIIHPELRIIIQMTSPSVYINAASFLSPKGEEIVHPLDLTLFANTLMFGCVAHRGLARTFLSLLNLEGTCIRRRRAKVLVSGPEQVPGDCIGKTFTELSREFVDAVLIGLVRPSSNTPSDLLNLNLGLCPDPEHVIEEDDMLIFVSSTISPHTSPESVELSLQSEAKAREDIKINMLDNETREVLTRRNVAVIGWRTIWETEAPRFKHRIDEIFEKCLSRSTLTFVTSLPLGVMRGLMERVGITFERCIESNISLSEAQAARYAQHDDDNTHRPYFTCDRAVYKMPAPHNDCYIIHVVGDGALPEVLEPVIFEKRIDTAIVLGTSAQNRSSDDGQIPKEKGIKGFHKDTRVLSILLLLKKVHAVKGEDTPMHIVGENTEDMTEKLALGPAWKVKRYMPSSKFENKTVTGSKATPSRRGTMSHVIDDIIKGEEGSRAIPDFVNTQAMFARGLVQVLAYPVVSSAITQLFDKRGANLELLRSAAFVPMATSISFSEVKALVTLRCRRPYTSYNGETTVYEVICLGYITSAGVQHIVPPLDEQIEFDEGYRLVVITRAQPKDENWADDDDDDADADAAAASGAGAGGPTGWVGDKINEEEEEEDDGDEEELLGSKGNGGETNERSSLGILFPTTS
jgi:hypothetical protein